MSWTRSQGRRFCSSRGGGGSRRRSSHSTDLLGPGLVLKWSTPLRIISRHRTLCAQDMRRVRRTRRAGLKWEVALLSGQNFRPSDALNGTGPALLQGLESPLLLEVLFFKKERTKTQFCSFPSTLKRSNFSLNLPGSCCGCVL